MYFLLEHLDGLAEVELGAKWRALCPCHSDTDPSLQITLENGKFLCHCFVCGADGAAVCTAKGMSMAALHADYDGAGYDGTTARPFVTKSQTVTPHNAQSEKLGLTLKEYADAKGFDVDKLKKWGLYDDWAGGGKWPRYNVVKIPYFDENGNPYHTNEKGESISIRIRRALKKAHGKADNRFLWYRGTKPSTYLYGAQYLAKWAEKDAENICIVEGESDCHAGWHGKIKVVGLPGAGMWNDAYLARLLSNYNKVNVFIERKPDGEKDSGGERLYNIVTGQDGKNNTSALIQKIRFVSVPPEIGKDLSDLWLHFGGDADKFHDYVMELLKTGEAYNGPITTDAQKTDAQKTDARSVSSKENGKKGGRPKEKRDPYDIALLFFQKGILYRYYRETWYCYDGAQYRSVEAGEMLQEIMMFLQELNEQDKAKNTEDLSEWLKSTDPNKGIFKPTREQEVKVSIANDVLANLATKRFYGLDNSMEAPFKILSDGKGEKLPGLWWSCLNGFVNIPEAAKRRAIIAGGQMVPPLDEAVFIPNTADIFNTKTLNLEFDETNIYSLGDSMLQDMLEQDAYDVIVLVCGLTLTPDRRHNQAILFYGPGGEGKGTLLKLLGVIFKGCHASVSLEQLGGQFGLTELSEYTINIGGELKEEDKTGVIRQSISGPFKRMTSGDENSFDEKFQKWRRKANFTALGIYTTNELYSYLACDGAALSRWNIIEFKKVFRGTDEEDTTLIESLTTDSELSAFFNVVMLQGYYNTFLKEYITKNGGKRAGLARIPETQDGLRRKEQLQVNITKDYIKTVYMYKEGGELCFDDEWSKYVEYCRGHGCHYCGVEKFTQTTEDLIKGSQKFKRGLKTYILNIIRKPEF